MQFVHKSILSSANQNPGCSVWIILRLIFVFKSMVTEKLFEVNFDGWSINVLPGIAAYALDGGSARGSVFSRHTGK